MELFCQIVQNVQTQSTVTPLENSGICFVLWFPATEIDLNKEVPFFDVFPFKSVSFPIQNRDVADGKPQNSQKKNQQPLCDFCIFYCLHGGVTHLRRLAFTSITITIITKLKTYNLCVVVLPWSDKVDQWLLMQIYIQHK